MTDIDQIIAETMRQLAQDDIDARRWRWWLHAPISEREVLAANPDPIDVCAYVDARLKSDVV